ncbi:SpoIIE family protein phosphatase [Nonomuraea sp. LP-02]|uniref:SpoIIE family protein phosphatase n=1 Tax=Nonomuraea sp. LP-02 TaxID=3097960 RepID=UPI002E35B9C8|nr:SpoIIE family protein phosphatase [Nonomuraea sp. LP-02]MED7926146.1 SpoIIE family protein phosphatase [Nonomuraea sp. LP-02]
MTFFVISILIGCLSVMNVQGRRGKWPPGMPVTRPRLVAVGGTFEGSRGRPSDAYVIQERLVATADGGTGSEAGHMAAALALAAVIAGRPQHGGQREQDLDDHVQAAHRAVRGAASRDPAMTDLAGGLDLIVLDGGESPRLRFAHVGNGAIWHCPRGGTPAPLTTPLTTPHSFDDALTPEVGAVAVRPGDRVVMMSDGVVQALGVKRVTELLTGSASPVSCLDRLYDELAAVEPKEDATVVIADFVTV